MIKNNNKYFSLFSLILLGYFHVFAAKPIVTIKSIPNVINSGALSTLTWSSTYATSASINQRIGSVPVNGSIHVSPAKTTTYTITVRNSSGYRTASAKVTVKPLLPTVTFSAVPSSILQGQASTLSWTTANATSVAINQGIGTVALNGSKHVTPATTTTYTITVSGSGGTITANAIVTVTSAPPPTASLTTNPVSICNGQSSLLSWTSANATSLVINNGVGSVALNGSATVSPALTTIYTLTANGPGGTATASAQIKVGSCPAPVATLTANPQTIQLGESTTLSWTTANADSVTLDNGIGAVELNGTLTLSPSATTTFTLVAIGSGGSQSFSTIVVVTSGKKCLAFIPDATDKTVHIIDTDSNSLQKTIIVAGSETSLQGVAAEASGVYVYVADAGPTRLLRIDPLTMTVTNEVSLDANFQGKPKHTAAAADGTYVYTTSSVPLWDPDAGKWVGHICAVKTLGNSLSPIRLVTTPLPSQVSLGGLAVSRDGTRLFVADPENARVIVLDTEKLHRWSANPVAMSDELVAAISLSHPPIELALSPDGQMLYAISSSDLVEIDATQFTVSRSLALTGALFLQASPDGSRVYVMSSKSLITVETVGFSKLATIAIMGMGTCSGFDVHPDGIRLFMVDRSGKKLFMVHAADGRVISTLALGSAPIAIGKFICPLPVTIAGSVRQDGNPLASVTMTLSGEGIARSKLTQAAGDFIFALKPGNYSLAPTFSNLAFSPESMDLQVSESLTGLDFMVSGVVTPPTVSLSTSKTWVKPYEDFTLTWDSTGADYVKIAEATLDKLPPSGSRSFALLSTATFTAVAYNRGGTTASPGITVFVDSMNPPTASISASPVSILQGGSATLTWNTTRAATVSIDNGIGTVAASGSKIVSPTATTTYTITAKHTNGYQVTASATITISEFDTSAKLTGTVTDSASSQPIADVVVTTLDASGVSRNAMTDATGKYSIAYLRVGDVTVSLSKPGYDTYQQTIQIPSNTTFDLTTQLHATLVGATLKGLVKDGQTNLPLVGATITATYSGTALTSTSAADGSYILAGIPLGVSAQIAAAYPDYHTSTINQSFSQSSAHIWDFVLYNNSAAATINGKIINAKTLLPETGVEVTHEASNESKTTVADGTFTFDNIPFGEQTFYLKKANFIDETYSCTIDRNPFTIDLTRPSSDGGQIKIGQNSYGVIQDAVSQKPLSGVVIRIPGMSLQTVTDAAGRYQFTSLPIGSYPLYIIAQNYMAMNFTADVNVAQTDQTDFALIPLTSGLIQGRVTDVDTGVPIKEASLDIEGSTMLGATSEGDGAYKMLGIPSGSYSLHATHPEYESASLENVVVKELTSTTADLKLKKHAATGALEGKILDVSTGNPVGGATVMAVGPGVSTTSAADGHYRLENIPAGLNDLIVTATGYPNSPRMRSVLVNNDSSPSTICSDINIDAGNSHVDEAVTVVIKANEGGDVITPDGRFLIHIFPGTLSADASITLKDAINGPNASIGSDLPLDPALKLAGIKASSIMTQIELSATNAGDPAPTINGMAAFAVRYSQKDIDTFHLDENSAFIYSWNGTHFTALDPRPYEFAVDKVNNIVFSAMDLTRTINGSVMQFLQNGSRNPSIESNKTTSANPTKIMIKIIGKSIVNTIFPPKANIKLFDKNELDCVAMAPDDLKPNPNALPLLVLHGFDPKTFLDLEKEVTDPNEEDRYRLMLEDIIDATNGVYRPIFVSYNTKAKIKTIAQSLAGKLLGDFFDQKLSLKGLPSDPSNPDSGTFPYVDTFGFSMGGLVSRAFIFFNRINRVRSMTMIGTPNHGVFNCLEYIFGKNPLLGGIIHVLRPLNFGAADMLDYDDSSPDGLTYNPFLFKLNSSIYSSLLTPRGDINLYAGTDESAWLGVSGALMPSPNDSLVTVKSVFCRPTHSTLESKQSLLKVLEPRARKYEHTKVFSHADIGTQENRIREFSEELAKGFSDWIVERIYSEAPSDNAFVKPTKDAGGYCKSKVKVEYNTWTPDSERQTRDFDRVVLVIYHKDGNGHWHISEPKRGENGADSKGKVNELKIEVVKGNSKKSNIGARILFASVSFDPNPINGELGYDPEKDIVDTVSLVIPLAPGKVSVPLDPTRAHFRTPGEGEWQ